MPQTKTNSVFKRVLLFCSLLWVRSGGGWQQIVCVQCIAAQESINLGLCKWIEQGHNQLQYPTKPCLLTHLLKHAGTSTASDFNEMNLKWWRFCLFPFFSSKEIISRNKKVVGRTFVLDNLSHRQLNHYEIEQSVLQAFLINYLPLATNTASVTAHHRPQTLIQEIHADNSLEAVLLS